jgi:AraC-like DNA-binding protein
MVHTWSGRGERAIAASSHRGARAGSEFAVAWHAGVVHRERPSSIAGAVVWTGVSDGSAGRILPDGCMDLMWYGGHLVVAGPDTSAHLSHQPAGTVTAGVRFGCGVAPGVLGAPAHVFRDERVRLDQLWTDVEVRRLEERVAAAAAPGRELEAIVRTCGRGPARSDPLIADVVRRARAGERVAAIAPAVGLSTRQLQRRALDAFGYGPKVLARILRLGDALDMARTGVSLAAVAARCGYADQAHLADDVRALAGTSLGRLGLGARPQPEASAANRSTELPSGSRTVA